MLHQLGAPPDREVHLEARMRRQKTGLFKGSLGSGPSRRPALCPRSELCPHGTRGSTEVLE